MNTREQFEEWSANHEILGGTELHKGINGDYLDVDLQTAWDARQAAASSATTCPGHGRPVCATCCWPGYTAVDMATAAADGYRDGKGEPLPRYTCIGKGGDYEFLGTATGSGTSRGAPQPYVYRDVATGQLYFREATDFYTRMEPRL